MSNIKNLLIKNLLRIPLINDYNIVTFFSAWSPSRKYGNYGAIYWNESIKSRVLFYIEKLKSKPNKLKEHKPSMSYVKKFLDKDNIIRHYKDDIGLITLIELEGRENLNDFLRVCMNPSKYLNEGMGKEYLNLIEKFPEKFGNLNINLIFSFIYSFRNMLNTIHNVNQLQITYSNEKTKKSVIIEILNFCKCPTLTQDDMKTEIDNYIKRRKNQMMYKNLQKINDILNRKVVLVHGSEKNSVNIIYSWLEKNI